MYLKEVLEVCRDDDIIILDRKGTEVIIGTKYADVHKYLWNSVLDISTRGYNCIYITIDYLENDNEETSD